MGKILIVDDDRIVRHTIKSVLIPQNFEVIEAENGKEGLSKAENQIFDLILLDILMPELNGWEFVAEYRKSSNFVFTPIIFMTTLNSVDTRANLFGNGADDFMQKPFPVAELSFRVHKAISYSKRIERYFVERKDYEVSGFINELGIASILAFLEGNKRTGTLTIKKICQLSHEVCRLFISGGKLEMIEIEGRISENIDMLMNEILTWTMGEYMFQKSDILSDKQLSITALIEKHQNTKNY